MMKSKNILCLSLIFLMSPVANAALSIDRTRVIFNGDNKSITLNVSNNSEKLPYLAQSWMENTAGEKIQTPFTILPPVQRVEPGKPTQIKIEALPVIKQLPQDRESLFYFNFREIPPKSDKPNVLQLSVQTKIKLFYRPESIVVTGADINNDPWQPKLVLVNKNNTLVAKNPTAYYTTIVGIADKNSTNVDNFKAFMVPPFSEVNVNVNPTKMGATPYLTYIDDYGGKVKMQFTCQSNECKYIENTSVRM